MNVQIGIKQIIKSPAKQDIKPVLPAAFFTVNLAVYWAVTFYVLQMYFISVNYFYPIFFFTALY